MLILHMFLGLIELCGYKFRDVYEDPVPRFYDLAISLAVNFSGLEIIRGSKRSTMAQ